MEIEKETTLKVTKEELIEKLGIKGNVTFISYDYKTGILTLKGKIESEEEEKGWFSFKL